VATSGGEQRFETVTMFGMPFSNVDFDDVCALVAERVRSREPGFIVTPNVDHVCLCQRDAEFRSIYDDAFLSLADGMPIIWASKLARKPLRAKVSGSDLVDVLCASAAREGFSVFLLGGAPGVGDRAADRLRERYAGLRIAGAYSPPLGFDTDESLNAETVAVVREAKPDIGFVALGAPRQERWIHRHQQACGVPVMAGIGAGIDFAAGNKRRAPVWMQRSGTEWLYRLAQEPGRLWKRYLVDDAVFFPLVVREMLGRNAPAANSQQR
jgi:N-acetylglucosaminyldiphosphoundecaprenol N-acetyl-beta-D-mannosaminyltransferase